MTSLEKTWKKLIDRPIRLISRASTYNSNDRSARKVERMNVSLRGKAGFQFHSEQGSPLEPYSSV